MLPHAEINTAGVIIAVKTATAEVIFIAGIVIRAVQEKSNFVRSRAYNSQKKGGRYQVRPLYASEIGGTNPAYLLPGNCWCSHRPYLDGSKIDVDHLDRVDAALRHWRSKYRHAIHRIYDLQCQTRRTDQRQLNG